MQNLTKRRKINKENCAGEIKKRNFALTPKKDKSQNKHSKKQTMKKTNKKRNNSIDKIIEWKKQGEM